MFALIIFADSEITLLKCNSVVKIFLQRKLDWNNSMLIG